MSMLSSATDFLYGANRARSSFELLNPDEQVLMSAACKARSPARPKVGSGWAFSKRSALIVTKKRVQCGEWEILVEDIERASFSAFNGALSRGMVLTIQTRDGRSLV